jgi:hypothetical protein
MKCVVNAAQLEKMLAQIKPSPIFRGCLLEASGDVLTITNADSRAVTSISVPARVEIPGRVSPDITMLRTLLKGIGSQDVELSLVDGMHRLRIKFEAGNQTESIYLIPYFDADDTPLSIVQDIKLEEAQLFAFFPNDALLKQTLTRMKKFISGAYFSGFIFIPEDGFVTVMSILPHLAAKDEVPAEVFSKDMIVVPVGIVDAEVKNLAVLPNERNCWVIALNDGGFSAFPSFNLTEENKQIVQVANELFNKEPSLVAIASVAFWQNLKKAIKTSSSSRSKHSRRYLKLDFDFEQGKCYLWESDYSKPEICYVSGEFPKIIDGAPIDGWEVISFSADLIYDALEFIIVPERIEFLISSDIPAIRLVRGSSSLMLAATVKGTDYKSQMAEVSET